MTAPASIDVSCLTLTFGDDFLTYDISSGPVDDGLHPGERWFNGTDQCCMSASDNVPGAMYPTPGPNGPVNPYALLADGGLQISLQELNGEWFSGVMTSLDGNQTGFAQQYGYFEMSAQLPPGTGTWPAFWMLSVPLPDGGGGGEIDVFEQYGGNPPLSPGFETAFNFTLHDWSTGTQVGHYLATGLPDLTAGFHRYGLLWSANYMGLYFDGQLLWSTPTPPIMLRPYYLLADMGLGGGWITTQTPSPSILQIGYIRAYAVPGF